MCLSAKYHLDQGPSALPEFLPIHSDINWQNTAQRSSYMIDLLSQQKLLNQSARSTWVRYCVHNFNDPNPVFSHCKAVWPWNVNIASDFIAYTNTTLRIDRALLNSYLVLNARLSENPHRMTTFTFCFSLEWTSYLLLLSPKTLLSWVKMKGDKVYF